MRARLVWRSIAISYATLWNSPGPRKIAPVRPPKESRNDARLQIIMAHLSHRIAIVPHHEVIGGWDYIPMIRLHGMRSIPPRRGPDAESCKVRLLLHHCSEPVRFTLKHCHSGAKSRSWRLAVPRNKEVAERRLPGGGESFPGRTQWPATADRHPGGGVSAVSGSKRDGRSALPGAAAEVLRLHQWPATADRIPAVAFGGLQERSEMVQRRSPRRGRRVFPARNQSACHSGIEYPGRGVWRSPGTKRDCPAASPRRGGELFRPRSMACHSGSTSRPWRLAVSRNEARWPSGVSQAWAASFSGSH